MTATTKKSCAVMLSLAVASASALAVRLGDSNRNTELATPSDVADAGAALLAQAQASAGASGSVAVATATNLAAQAAAGAFLPLAFPATGAVARAGVVTGTQSNALASALQPSSTNGWEVGSHATLVTTGQLATAVASKLEFTAGGTLIGGRASGVATNYTDSIVLGWEAGSGGATGKESVLLGSEAGSGSALVNCLGLGDGVLMSSVGSGSTAIGNSAMPATHSEFALGVGRTVFAYAAITNSTAIGSFAGSSATGSHRFYIDVYSDLPLYAPGDATNDRIFGDSDGALYLGRGAGAPGGAVGGTLRGPWTGGGYAQESALAGYVATNAIPGPGCTDISAGGVVAGATAAHWFSSATNYTLSVSESAPRYTYSIEVLSTNAATFAEGIELRGAWTPSGTNLVVIAPSTGTLWRAYGRAF